MKARGALIALAGLLCAGMLFAQEGGGRGGRGGRGQNAAPPAMDKVTPEVPGVVKAGTKIEIIKYGMGGSDSGTGMPDGSVLVSSQGKVLKIAPDGSTTTLVEDSE